MDTASSDNISKIRSLEELFINDMDSFRVSDDDLLSGLADLDRIYDSFLQFLSVVDYDVSPMVAQHDQELKIIIRVV